MLFFVLAIIFVLVGVAALFIARLAKKSSDPDAHLVVTAAKFAAIGSAVAVVLTTLGCSFTIVSSRAVGIETAFGKPQGNLSNGPHLIAPWADVEEFTTRVQYLDLDGNSAVNVTFKGGGGGTVNVTPRWRIDPDRASDLWKKYRTFDNVRDNLVASSAKDSVRIVTSEYTPNDARSGENLRVIAAKIQEDLAKSLSDDGILIDSVSIKNIALDKRSQNSLDKVVEANNNIERAKAEQLRAKIDAETAKIRQQSGALSPEALVRQCLDVTDKWSIQNNGELPPGWNCFSLPQVLIGAKK